MYIRQKKHLILLNLYKNKVQIINIQREKKTIYKYFKQLIIIRK